MKLTKEDELLLEQYGRTASAKSNKLIYGNALLVSLTPICNFFFVSSKLLSAYLISLAYTNSKSPLMERWATIRRYQKRKKMICKIRQKTKDVADYESTTFSIFYINAIFILIALISSTVYFVDLLSSYPGYVFWSQSNSVFGNAAVVMPEVSDHFYLT
ncbi:unnamed protein product [Schistocephalus solidus]|uniref:Translocon-associated protein subunit gamma n=1 Tax=Schistocephalus solidus TaxID=70667 RepID=A0A183SIN6_SCHSO|nr:unnamed protein product [Schistocephalus solidus]